MKTTFHSGFSNKIIMKKAIGLALFTIVSIALFGQNEYNSKWTISINYGIQEPDSRLFGYPEIPKRNLLAQQKENPRTYQFSLNIYRRITTKNKFNLSGGLGISSELNTFKRPFFHGYGHQFFTDVLVFTNKYRQYILQFPFQTSLNILKPLAIQVEILPQFNFFTTANDTKELYGTTKWWRFELYSIEINPGIVWTTKKLDFGISYRFFQHKRIDPILFSAHMSTEPDTDQTFETFNPFKLWFSVGYKF